MMTIRVTGFYDIKTMLSVLDDLNALADKNLSLNRPLQSSLIADLADALEDAIQDAKEQAEDDLQAYNAYYNK